MAFVENELRTNRSCLPNPQPLEWALSPIESSDIPSSDPKDVDITLHFVSEDCPKSIKRKIFKEIYQNVMDKNPEASYQEKLDLSAKYITKLQEQNPDIQPEVFKSMKRSFAAKTGYEITKLRKEIKNTESNIVLDNGKEFHYKHPWSHAVEKVLKESNNDKKAEKEVLVKIIDFRTKLGSIINSKNADNPEETLKICENHIANLIKNKDGINPETFLNGNCINDLINPQRNISSIYMSPMASNNEPLALDTWVTQVIRNNTPHNFISNK